MSEDMTPEYRISQALLWLGFEDVEVGKRFSSEKFQNQEKNVLIPHITYSTKDTLIPKSVSSQLIKFMDNVLYYHQQLKDKEERKLEAEKRAAQAEREAKLAKKEAEFEQVNNEQKGEDNE